MNSLLRYGCSHGTHESNMLRRGAIMRFQRTCTMLRVLGFPNSFNCVKVMEHTSRNAWLTTSSWCPTWSTNSCGTSGPT